MGTCLEGSPPNGVSRFGYRVRHSEGGGDPPLFSAYHRGPDGGPQLASE
jgi:hypothetical protein